MIDILFTYQHKPREIETLCLLKLEMERRGFTTDFICTFVPNRLLSFFQKAKLTVSSAMYNTDTLWFFVYDIVGFTKKIINIQWEQVLTNYDEANPNCFHNPKEFAKEVVHLCWGEEPKKRITKGGVSFENAPITGAVHLDFLLKEFDGYFLNKKELSQLFNIDYHAEWCLFISSFTTHNMTEEEFKQLLNSFGDKAREFRQITIVSKMHILAWIETALLKYPEKLFIYRPHPDETSDESLLNMEKKYQNFKIIPNLSVKQWIKCVERIYTWYSTSAAEIETANKGFDILRPTDIPLKYDVSFYNGAKFIQSEESFLNSLKIKLQLIPLDIDLLHRYYKNDNEYPAYMRVADVLEKALTTNDLDMKNHPTRFSVNIELMKKTLRKVIKDLILKLMGKNATKLPFLANNMAHSIAYNNRLKRDLPKNFATKDEIDMICDKLRPIVNADFFSKNKSLLVNIDD